MKTNILTQLESLTDPVFFKSSLGTIPAYFTIKLPLDKVTIEHFDWETGDFVDEQQSPTRWRAITDVVDELRVKSYRKYANCYELDIIILIDDLDAKYAPYLTDREESHGRLLETGMYWS